MIIISQLAKHKAVSQNKFEMIQAIETSFQNDTEVAYEDDVSAIVDRVKKIYKEE